MTEDDRLRAVIATVVLELVVKEHLKKGKKVLEFTIPAPRKKKKKNTEGREDERR